MMVHEAHATFQNAKRRLREARNARGYFKRQPPQKRKPHGTHFAVPEFAESQHPRVLRLKESKPCHSCGKTGHWQFDSICENFDKDMRERQPHGAHVSTTWSASSVSDPSARECHACGTTGHPSSSASTSTSRVSTAQPEYTCSASSLAKVLTPTRIWNFAHGSLQWI